MPRDFDIDPNGPVVDGQTVDGQALGRVGLRLALFDLDGTLSDSRSLMFEALDLAARHFGFHRISAEQAEALRDKDARTILDRLGVPLWKLPLVASFIKARANAAPPPPLFPGAAATLARLRQAGITLALVTSNSEANARRTLGPAVVDMISHWACDAALFGKAGRFRQVLRVSGERPERSIAIGDELRDIDAARSSGVQVGAVSWGYAVPEALAAAKPDVLFAKMADIPAWFGA